MQKHQKRGRSGREKTRPPALRREGAKASPKSVRPVTCNKGEGGSSGGGPCGGRKGGAKGNEGQEAARRQGGAALRGIIAAGGAARARGEGRRGASAAAYYGCHAFGDPTEKIRRVANHRGGISPEQNG